MNIFMDHKNKFVEKFDPKTGFYMRSGIIENGKDTGVDPFMRCYPSLIDVGIMGNCEHGAQGLCKQSGVQCYQKGFTKKQDHMTLENFKKIIDESKGKVFQVALGGRGDVNKHPQYEEILKYCRDNGIVPNFTTSGLNLTEEEVQIAKKYCGAVAISWYRQEHTITAIQMFLAAGVKTNIHYVLGNFSIDEAIEQVTSSAAGYALMGEPYKSFPMGINAVVFLSHKPVGQGSEKDVLVPSDKVERFFTEIDKCKTPFKIGFDSCTICGVLNYTKNINMDSTDYCEGARHSMYITPDMKALPCSFDQGLKWAVDINDSGIEEAWNSEKFESFRSYFRNSCSNCSERELCMGGCPIVPQIALCDRKDKDQNGILKDWSTAI